MFVSRSHTCSILCLHTLCHHPLLCAITLRHRENTIAILNGGSQRGPSRQLLEHGTAKSFVKATS